MHRTIAIALLLMLIASITSPTYLVERAVGDTFTTKSTETALDTTDVEYSISGRTGSLGHTAYSSGLDAYIVAWIRKQGTFYFGTEPVDIGDLYVAIIDPDNPGTMTTILVDDSDKAFYIDSVVAGDNSFLVGYSIVESNGENIDVKYALVKNDGGSWQVGTYSPFTDNSNNETLAGASYLNGKYLLVYWYSYSSISADLKWGVLDESTETVTWSGDYLSTNNRPWYASYTVIPDPDNNWWMIIYTKYDSDTKNDIYACPIYLDGNRGYYKSVITDTTYDELENVFGGAYINGKYVFAYSPGYSKYVVVYNYSAGSYVRTLLSSDAMYPVVVKGSSTVLVVWRDLVDGSDSYGGNVYAKLIDPSTWSISDTIDIGWDSVNNYYEHHIWARHVLGKEYYVIAWSRSVNIEGSWYNRIYVVLLNETMDDPSIVSTTPMEVTHKNYNDYVHGVASDGDTVLIAFKRESYAYALELSINVDIPEPAIAGTPSSAWVYFTPWEADEAKAKLLDLINNAKYYIYIEVYLWGDPSSDSFAKDVADALKDAITRGVDVKVILDEYYVNDAAESYLENLGVEVKRESGDGILHSKYFVIDDEYSVIMSANLKYYNFYNDYNNIVIINNTRLAQNLKIEFQEKWSGSTGVFHGGAETVYKEIDTVINGSSARIWSFIGPEDNGTYKDLVYELIDNATSSVYLMFFDFTNGTIANLLIQKKNDGLDVRGIFEAGQYWKNTTAHEYDWLVDNGVLVTLDKDHTDPDSGIWYPYMHHKVFIIDNKIVYFGSAHPTYYGWNINDEVIVAVNSTIIAQAFIDAFEKLWRRYTIRVDVNVTVNGGPATGAQVGVTDYGNGTNIDRVFTTGSDGIAHCYLVHPYYHINRTYDYEFQVTYTGYPSVSKTLTLSTGDVESLTINYIDTTLSASGPTTGKVEDTLTYTITLSGTVSTPSTATVEIKINGNSWKNVTVTSGSGSVDIKFNVSGTYSLEFIYHGDEEALPGNEYNEYTASSDSMTVTISEKSSTTTIESVTPVSPKVGDTITVIARVVLENGTPVANAPVRFVYNSTTEYTVYTNGTGHATDTYIPGSPGPLTIDVYYDGVSGKYTGSSDSATVIVGVAYVYVDTEINITGPDTVYVGDTATYTVRLQYASNHSVIPLTTDIDLYLNGSKQTVTLVDGVYTFTLTLDTPGPFNVTAVFNGTTVDNTVYNPSSGTKITIVKEYTYVDTEIVIEGPSATYVGQTETYTIKLQYAVNHSVIPIDTTVTVYLNGTPQMLSLISGTSTLSITPTSPGPYNITVVYSGETVDGVVYRPSSATLIVSVNPTPVYETQVVIEGPASIHLYETVDYTIKLEFTNGTVIKLTTTVTAYVNGLSTTVNLVDGVGTLTVSPDKLGPLNITVVFSGATVGSITYKPSSNTRIVQVVKRGVTIVINVDASTHWINRTHLFLNISGEVRDAVNNSLVKVGYVNIYVKKDNTWKLVASNIPLVNGRYEWSGVVDPPEEVEVEYVDPTGTYTSGAGEGATETASLPHNPYAIPAPEPWITAILLLTAILAILYLLKRR